MSGPRPNLFPARGWHRFGLCGLVLMLLCSCTLPPTVPRPPLEQASAAELLAAVRQREESCSSLRGLAQVSWREGQRSALKSRQALLVRPPVRIRSELFGLLGQPVLVAAVNDRTITALDLSAGVFYHGPASADNLYRLLHLPLVPADLVRLALNQPPPGDFTGPATVVTSADGYRLTRSNREWKQELRFSPEHRLTGIILYLRGEEELEAEYADFTGGGGDFPLQMRLFLPLRDVEVNIRFTSLEIGVPLADNLFELRAPDGFQVHPLP